MRIYCVCVRMLACVRACVHVCARACVSGSLISLQCWYIFVENGFKTASTTPGIHQLSLHWKEMSAATVLQGSDGRLRRPSGKVFSLADEQKRANKELRKVREGLCCMLFYFLQRLHFSSFCIPTISPCKNAIARRHVPVRRRKRRLLSWSAHAFFLSARIALH